MSDVASLSVAMHLNSAAFKSQIADAYQSAGRSSQVFNGKQKAQASELATTIGRTLDAIKKVGGQKAGGGDTFSGATRGAGQLNYVLHEMVSGSQVASSTLINALIPAVHSLKNQLSGSAGGWQVQQAAAKSAAAELAEAAQQQITVAQTEKQAALNKVVMAEKTLAAAQAQREQAIALDEYFAKQTEVNKLHGVTVSYQEEHVKNERAILEANKAEAAALEKLKTAQLAATAADAAETEGKAALTAATEAATAASTELTLSQRLAASGSRALSSAMSLLGGPVGLTLTAVAAAGTYLWHEFQTAEEHANKLNSAILDLNTSALVTPDVLKSLNEQLGDTNNSITAVTAAAKAGFSGQMLTDVATLSNAYANAGGNAQDLVSTLSSLKGDPVSAMEKLTASGVALDDTVVQQILDLNKKGNTAVATQIIMEQALGAEKKRLDEIASAAGGYLDRLRELAKEWGVLGGLTESASLVDSLTKDQKALDDTSRRFIAASEAGYAQAQSLRIKNARESDHYAASAMTAAEKRAAAIKTLNNSIYTAGSEKYQQILKGINAEYEKATKKRKTGGSGESEGQRELEQARQKNSVLQDQLKNTRAQTESEKQLSAFDRKISDLKGEHLSKSQQSLVSMQGQIRAQLQANVQLEREAALRKTISKWQAESRQWDEEAAAMQREAQQSLGKYYQSDNESGNTAARDAVTNRFNQRRIKLEQDFTDKTSAEYKTRLADLDKHEAAELTIVEKGVQDKLAAEGDYTAGFRRGAQNWIDSARDANSQMAGFATALFDDMTDSLATFATTGKLSFRSFTTSVLSDLSKIAMKIALSSALEGIFGSLGSAAAGGSTPSGAYGAAAANLKFNAKGGVYDSPSLSSYSNGVYNSPRTFAFAKGAGVFAEAGPEAIMPLTRAGDGSLGVRAISDGGQQASGSAIISVNAPVTITQQSGAGGSSGSAGATGIASQLKSIVETTLTERLRREISPGGLLYRK